MQRDLSQGIPSGDLTDMLAGELDGEQVLLVRRGEAIHAVGGTCTHYSGPLVEGLVVGDTVRCPWHHACFDLKTGEALRGPALMPLPVYDVEERDGRIRVWKRGGPRSSAAPAAEDGGPPQSVDGGPPQSVDGGPPQSIAIGPSQSIAIVGAGAAGLAAANMLRRRGYAGSIAMFGPEAPVDRPNLSKDYLAGHAPEEWLPLPMPDNVEHVQKRVTALDAKTKTLTLDDGSSRAFDAILLATGAEPIRLPIRGADQPHVHYLRTAADSRAIIAAAEKSKRAVIIGAGFIGLEVAAALRARDIEVTVIAPEAIPLARILGDEAGRFIQRLHEQHGVNFLLGNGVQSIERESVVTSDGQRLEAGFVVMGTGVRPNTALAEAAGLRVENGIVVDEYLQTSAHGIYAAGDVARWPDRFSGRAIRVEHWVVAEHQAQAAALNLLGHKRPYTNPPFFWSAHYDVSFSYVGNAAGWDHVEIRGSFDDRNVLIAYRTNGRVAAVATIFRDRESLAIEHAMENGDIDAIEKVIAAA